MISRRDKQVGVHQRNHNIKMSGMPSWQGHGDEALWKYRGFSYNAP
jgi:hypothetical protein